MHIEQIGISNRQELEKILVKEIESIEVGLTTIGNQIPINSQTKLDILCHDENGQLVVFQLSATEDDTMLFEGLKALNQLDTVKHILRFHYKDFKMSEDVPPRLALVAPSFSKNLLRIAESVSGIRIDLYEWEYLKFGDNEGLRIKPISLSKETEEKRRSKERKKKEKPSQKMEKHQSPQEEVTEPDFGSSIDTKPEEPQEPVSWESEKRKGKTKKKTLLRF